MRAADSQSAVRSWDCDLTGTVYISGDLQSVDANPSLHGGYRGTPLRTSANRHIRRASAGRAAHGRRGSGVAEDRAPPGTEIGDPMHRSRAEDASLPGQGRPSMARDPPPRGRTTKGFICLSLSDAPSASDSANGPHQSLCPGTRPVVARPPRA